MADCKYLITAEEIDAMEGLPKTHFLNSNAKRINKSLGDAAGLTGLGFHIIEVKPGFETTEYHRHHYEDECVYILSGTGKAVLGSEETSIKAGDFIGYRKGGMAHTIVNNGDAVLRMIVVGERLDHDVADYPRKSKRIFRNKGMAWNLVDTDAISSPPAGTGRKA